MFLSLFIISLVVAVLLAQVNKMTAKPIAAAKALKLENAIKEVVPEFDNNPVEEAYKMPVAEGDSLLVYPAKKGDEVVGFAVNTYSNNGFSGNIQLMVGFDMEDKVVNYAVLSHAETPGLGSKMNEWFRDTNKPGQVVIGRNLSEGNLSVSKDGGQIDAITASTITSRAFLEAVNKAYAVYKSSDADSSATKLNNAEERQEEEGGENNE
ncbi:MAG: Electron transport complex protein RnfG [Bacteroidetes bacterium ADurb.BinA174]|nr:MAG: Electron transport complex protein RnfG [Bacteroidetes bacterium ADurb.BinA174]